MPAVQRAGLGLRRGRPVDRAERDGDEWVVNGQKVWTTLAHLSSFGLHLARTNPDVPKHQGHHLLPRRHARAPASRCGRCYQITGEAEFNEVFFNDVPHARRGAPRRRRRGLARRRHHADERAGLDRGRRRAAGRRPHRRGHAHLQGALVGPDRRPRRRLRDRLCSVGGERGDPLTRRARPTSATRAEGARRDPRARSPSWPSPSRTSASRPRSTCSGTEGMLYSDDYPKIRPDAGRHGRPDVHKQFLRTRANSIEGGTSEVMKNILGERVLGLPGDVRSDKEVAWKDVPRS